MCVVFWAKCCGFFACMLVVVVVVIPVRKTRPYFFLFLLRFDATTDCLLEGYDSFIDEIIEPKFSQQQRISTTG